MKTEEKHPVEESNSARKPNNEFNVLNWVNPGDCSIALSVKIQRPLRI
jgi:hypothetical protein